MESSELEFKISDIIKLYILVTLSSSPIHGYKLMKELEKKLGKKPSAAQVYPFLIKLKKNGYLKIYKEEKRGKKVYELTQRGHSLVQHILSRVFTILNAALDTQLKVCINCGCKIYEGGYTIKENNKALVFCCVHCYKNYENEKIHSYSRE